MRQNAAPCNPGIIPKDGGKASFQFSRLFKNSFPAAQRLYCSAQ
jgi:hypothetical protein